MVYAKDIMRTDFISVSPETTVAELVGKMKSKKQAFALVFDNGNYLGLVSKKWLLTSRIDPDVMKIKNIIKHSSKAKTPFHVPILSPDTELREMCRLMATADVHCLPVIEKKKVIGVVRARELIAALKNNYARIPAIELASTKLLVFDQNDEIGKVINLMNKRNVERAPVTNGAGKLVGIVTLVDIIERYFQPRCKGQRIPKAASHGKMKITGFGTGEKTELSKCPVHNIITHVPLCFTAPPTAMLSEIIEIMLKNEVCSVILTQNEKPVGIVTEKDILLDFARR